MKKYDDKKFQFWNLARKYLHNYLVYTLDRSPETIKAYKLAVENYIDFLEVSLNIKRNQIDFECFSRINYELFIRWLRETKQYCNKTINLKTTAIRSFLKFAGDEDVELMKFYLAVYPIKSQKIQRKPIEYMTNIAMTSFLNAFEADTRNHRRNRTMLILTYELGMRISEVTNLTAGAIHLDIDNPYVTIVGKGNKTRQVPISNKTVNHLNEYLKEFNNDTNIVPLFYSLRDGMPHKLSVDAVEKVIKKAAEIARTNCTEIPSNVHCHLIRKTRAMDLYKAGISLHIIARMLGHKNVSTTSGFYAFATYEMIVEALSKTNNEAINEPIHYSAQIINDFLYSLD